ncbi:hypothetical protein phi9184_ORF029 [Enterococcus phage 9184]|uniref:Uncharacterized protein n=1 Tax=Enterococcus phage 9184 TaxID=2763103 RepID=A0A7L8ZIH2_9CAUD|nr:hypothetical protein phi9184_ORF029 [Enterococcus phage 9184]
MSLTTEELLKLVEEHDSKAVEFEKNIVRYTGLEHSELEEYNTSTMIVLLGLIKLNQATVDEILETCVKNLHK